MQKGEIRMSKNVIGIIGGSGLEKAHLVQSVEEILCTTPWGRPSSTLKKGNVDGVDVIFLSRHGYKHEITPTQVNCRANIHALKVSGCTHILASTAVGSLQEHIKPGHLVVLDQFIDFTRLRPLSFFEDFTGGIKHTSLADPFNETIRNILIQEIKKLGYDHHAKGTVVTIEGPRFSTRAESHMFKLWGADVINMSTAPEAILAAEAEIPYASIAMSTDYDAWKADAAPVTWEEVSAVMQSNANKVLSVFKAVIPAIGKI